MVQQSPFPPPQYTSPKQRRGPLVLVGVLGLLLVLVLGTAGALLVRRFDEPKPATSAAQATKPSKAQ
jgi:hypothetical protein